MLCDWLSEITGCIMCDFWSFSDSVDRNIDLWSFHNRELTISRLPQSWPTYNIRTTLNSLTYKSRYKTVNLTHKFNYIVEFMS